MLQQRHGISTGLASSVSSSRTATLTLACMSAAAIVVEIGHSGCVSSDQALSLEHRAHRVFVAEHRARRVCVVERRTLAGAEAKALAEVDSHVAALWRAAAPNTLFAVASLGGNTALSRWLFEVKTKRQARQAGFQPWSPACEAFFQQHMDRAIQGCLWLAVKP